LQDLADLGDFDELVEVVEDLVDGPDVLVVQHLLEVWFGGGALWVVLCVYVCVYV
jgi:hypothetical protein